MYILIYDISNIHMYYIQPYISFYNNNIINFKNGTFSYGMHLIYGIYGTYIYIRFQCFRYA